MQTAETYKEFIGTDEISYGGNNFEIYFEEEDFDKFSDRLKELDIEYVHPVTEHSWGQRVVRFYDPDRHIIEVGENMKAVCRRFLDSGGKSGVVLSLNVLTLEGGTDGRDTICTRDR